mgnify:FL=1
MTQDEPRDDLPNWYLAVMAYFGLSMFAAALVLYGRQYGRNHDGGDDE